LSTSSAIFTKLREVGKRKGKRKGEGLLDIRGIMQSYHGARRDDRVRGIRNSAEVDVRCASKACGRGREGPAFEDGGAIRRRDGCQIKRVDVARAISRPRPAVFMLGWKGEFLGGETHIKHSDENGSVYVYRGKLYKRHSGISISPACCANASNTCI
jgi:hypothetical protein